MYHRLSTILPYNCITSKFIPIAKNLNMCKSMKTIDIFYYANVKGILESIQSNEIMINMTPPPINYYIFNINLDLVCSYENKYYNLIERICIYEDELNHNKSCQFNLILNNNNILNYNTYYDKKYPYNLDMNYIYNTNIKNLIKIIDRNI